MPIDPGVPAFEPRRVQCEDGTTIEVSATRAGVVLRFLRGAVELRRVDLSPDEADHIAERIDAVLAELPRA